MIITVSDVTEGSNVTVIAGPFASGEASTMSDPTDETCVIVISGAGPREGLAACGTAIGNDRDIRPLYDIGHHVCSQAHIAVILVPLPTS